MNMENTYHLKISHSWPHDIYAATKIQEELRAQIIFHDDFDKNNVKFIAGIDVGFENNGEVTRAAVVTLSWPELNVIEKVVSRGITLFPYVPGFLSFREIPEILKSFAKTQTDARSPLLRWSGRRASAPNGDCNPPRRDYGHSFHWRGKIYPCRSP